MIDDFLTSPRDLPSLRSCRTTPRPDEEEATPVAPESPSAPALAASIVLAVAMIGQSSAPSPTSNVSKTPGGSSRTL